MVDVRTTKKEIAIRMKQKGVASSEKFGPEKRVVSDEWIFRVKAFRWRNGSTYETHRDTVSLFPGLTFRTLLANFRKRAACLNVDENTWRSRPPVVAGIILLSSSCSADEFPV